MAARFDLQDDENGTCTLLVLRDFGGKACYSVFDKACVKDDEVDNPVSLEAFKARCRQEVRAYDNNNSSCWDDPPYLTVDTLAAVMATTSDLQTHAEENLKALGFVQNGPFPSKKYNGVSNISIWVLPVTDFLEAIKE